MSDGPFRCLHGHHEGPKPDDLMQILFDQVGTAAGFSKTRGFHTFGERLAIKDGSGHEFRGHPVGRPPGRPAHVRGQGEHSQKAAEALRARFDHRVTRVDACADFDAQGPLKPSWRHPSRSRRSAASWAAKLAVGRLPGEGPDFVPGQPEQPRSYASLRKGPSARICALEPAQLGPH